ncbi:MAG: hypothetical protein JWM71_1078 [Solirubrobacteraceae bacterium]|nr:hypothetical protein [Solirubrobacteraceae bacterium]
MSLITLTRRRAALGALAAVSLLAAGCGDDDSDTGSAAGSTAKSGETIVVGGAAPLNNPQLSDPQRRAGIEAAISKINEDGGIGGRQVRLEWCDTNYNANGELACARKLAAAKVSAVLAPAFLADPTGRAYTELERAKIPVIGDQGLTPAGLNSPISFPMSSGLPGWAFGAVDALVKEGSKKISIFVDPNPSSQFGGQLSAAALGTAKMKPVATVTGDPSSDPSLSSAASKAIRGGVDGVVITLAPPTLPKAVAALRQAGYKGKIATLTALAPDEILAALGDAGEGMLLSSQIALVTDTANEGVSRFLADMKQFQPKAKVDERAEIGWGAMQLFAAATKDLKDFSGTTVTEAMNNLATPVEIGITAP